MGVVRLGGGQAGYGDSPEPIADQLDAGIDYLVCDALAESTLAVLQKDRQRNEAFGYARDLARYVRVALPSIQDGATKFITNAGGLNPIAAGREVVRALHEAGAGGLKVATVVGDDVRPLGAGLGLPEDVIFANAYLGARPIVEALRRGAQIVVTGRVADASLFLAPLIFERGWAWDDWDRLAAGITVGHLLECSAQVSGLVYSGPWWEDPDPQRPGYPIAEVAADGSAVITKPEKADGTVNFDTVREQLLYEVHDPTAYLNPDGTGDFTSVCVDDLGDNRVRVSGMTGGPPPSTYKALYCRPAGWAGDATHVFSWPDAEAKAKAVNAAFKGRVAASGLEVQEWCEEYFGAGAFHGDAAREDLARAREAGWEPPEVVTRMAWRCKDEATVRAVGAIRGGQSMAMAWPFGRPKKRKPTQLVVAPDFRRPIGRRCTGAGDRRRCLRTSPGRWPGWWSWISARSTTLRMPPCSWRWPGRMSSRSRVTPESPFGPGAPCQEPAPTCRTGCSTATSGG
jgi:hypothetical protein